MIPVWITALLQMITEGFKFGSKVTPPDEIRIDRHEIKKPTLEVGERIKRQNKVFNKIKNVPDADIRSFVLEWTDMNEEDTNLMVENIRVRINEYRRDFPIISGWRRFLKSN